jgi:signal transduction histidine kinase
VPHEHLGLFNTPPDQRQVRLSLAVAGLLFCASIPMLLVRDVRLPEVDSFFPIIDAILFIGEVITATLLYAQASVFRSRALAILGSCYLFTGLLLIPHALTYPGAFSRNGLLGAGVNTTALIMFLRQPAFAIAVIAYALSKPVDLKAKPEADMPAPRIPLQILGAIVLAAVVTILTTSGLAWLPPVFVDRTRLIQSDVVGYESVAIALWLVAIAVLWRRRSSVLDMWLLVALASWLLVALLTMTVPARFTAGFYWLSVVAMFSHLVVMLALIAESTRLHARLALSKSAWNREREARLMSIDALAAAISHEVGQPLTAVRIHANAALTCMSGEQPNSERAIRSMRAAIEAGNQAIGIITSIRETFAKKPNQRTTFSVDDLVHTTVPLLQRELASGRVSLHVTLDQTLPPVLADRIQLQRVLANLLSNAIESVGATEERPRRIAIRSAPLRGQGVVLEISDNGVGIARENMPHIFAPFFTTKPAGAGLGLSLCRVIVEAHGGALWASRGEDYGATFHMELPAGGSQAVMTNSDHGVDSVA